MKTTNTQSKIRYLELSYNELEEESKSEVKFLKTKIQQLKEEIEDFNDRK